MEASFVSQVSKIFLENINFNFLCPRRLWIHTVKSSPMEEKNQAKITIKAEQVVIVWIDSVIFISFYSCIDNNLVPVTQLKYSNNRDNILLSLAVRSTNINRFILFILDPPPNHDHSLSSPLTTTPCANAFNKNNNKQIILL